MRQFETNKLYRLHQALTALPLAVTVETPTGRLGVVRCRTLRDNRSATLNTLEERNMAAINTVLSGILPVVGKSGLILSLSQTTRPEMGTTGVQRLPNSNEEQWQVDRTEE